MATILLSAAGAALGSGFGGTVLGLSGAVIGRAIGASVGRAIDQKILGGGSEAVEVGKIERFRVMGASEGAAISQIWGRARVAGQVIWASRFLEQVTTTKSGGKSTSRSANTVSQYAYSVSLAVALCEGEIASVGRIWADGNEIAPKDINFRVYNGSQDQLPDPKIEAVEGAGQAPSYRGTAYVVIEDLPLGNYGNRVPQFSFEVIRHAQSEAARDFSGLSKLIPGVCLIPGTGEYAFATTPVHYNYGIGSSESSNVNSITGLTDFTTSLAQLSDEIPNAKGVSLVVSWFGNDLRCGHCTIQPKVEKNDFDGFEMPWMVSGLNRANAALVPKVSGSAIYGGTPSDRSIVQAIAALNAAGKDVTFYPFILMDQLAGNALHDPYSGEVGQAALPWRGRITLNEAPGQLGTSDQTNAAATEVASFFGSVASAHFGNANGIPSYSGPNEWSYRRFILHYATLCKLAGGVSAFCIGSELRGLTQIRGANGTFPTVVQLRQLAADVRSILGPDTKISYAADWSEYFGYHVDGDVYFHLDPLWADPDIDFIGIDNYMPISDWRDGSDHADAHWGSIYNRDYLKANVAGGEGFDWYYADDAAIEAQDRLPISDGAHGEDWIFRPKDLVGWWSSSHHQRVDGVRAAVPTEWIAGSKPIRFTEFGCAAINKGTNQPNKFLDPKSSESALPRYSNGQRDDFLQLCYFQVMHEHWSNVRNNPPSLLYDGAMLDFAGSTAWAWDTRPFPAFPNNSALWTDGPNYDRGHWLNGRASNAHIAGVIADICAASGLAPADVSGSQGVVRGYVLSEIGSARSAIQPLSLAYPMDIVERDGAVRFQARGGKAQHMLSPEDLAISAELDGPLELSRSAEVEMPAHLRLSFIEADSDFAVTTAAASMPGKTTEVVSQSELPLMLTATEAISTAERWMAEAHVSRDSLRFALPRSKLGIGVGDTVGLTGNSYRIDRIELSEMQLIEAVRVDSNIYLPSEISVPPRTWVAYSASVPVFPLLMDLPLLSGNEVEYAPHIAVAASPWPGSVAVWSALTDDGYALNTTVTAPAVIGVTQTALSAKAAGLWDRDIPLRVRVESGSLSSSSELSVLSGANVAAIGDGSSANWEIFQFVNATLVAPKTYDLSLRLRGQAGSNATIPEIWPAGSLFVLLDGAVKQIDLPLSARGLPRNYRVVAADVGYDDPSAVLLTKAFDGIGLRPLSVCHLKAKATGGDISVTWIRRTRLDGDSWQSVEVPLGEETESYRIQLHRNGALLREVTVATPMWTYTQAMQVADGTIGAVDISVAQISARFGAGPSVTIALPV